MTLPDRQLIFPLPTRWTRPEYGGYQTNKIPTVRQVQIEIPGDFDGADVDRIAELLRACIDEVPAA